MVDSSKDAGQQRPLDEEAAAELNALDPHAVVSTKPWEFEARSSFLTKVAIVAIVVVMAAHIWVGITVNDEYTGASITLLDQLAFPGVGLVISVLVGIALTRPRLRANADGVQVRNIVGTRFYPWAVIYGLTFPEDARMARLELPEFEFVPVWALQSADGERTLKAVAEFRDLEARYMPVD